MISCFELSLNSNDWCQTIGENMDNLEDNLYQYDRSDDEADSQPQGRHGGPQAAEADEDTDPEAERKAQDRERKKAEVRARLQEAGKAKKAKKGFLTPERKKRLRKLLMQKAAEDLKQEQLKKEHERQKVLQERIVKLPDVESINNQAELEKLAQEFHKRIVDIYASKYDLDYEVRQKDFEINELTIAVNDLRGKFVKPALKKVSKYANKLKRLQGEKEDKVDFRSNLKTVKKKSIAGLLPMHPDAVKKEEGASDE